MTHAPVALPDYVDVAFRCPSCGLTSLFNTPDAGKGVASRTILCVCGKTYEIVVAELRQEDAMYPIRVATPQRTVSWIPKKEN
jgi:transcription elongation factor Elf1